MKRLITITMAGYCMAAASIGAQAQTAAVPVEMFVCSFNEGMGMKDLNKAAAKFEKWRKKNDGQYRAWTMTPQFRANMDEFGVGWIGSWADGKSMGAGLDSWLATGDEAAAGFAEVMSCDSHMLAASYTIHAPDGPPANGNVWFSSCTVDDGKTMADAMAAHGKAAAALRENGVNATSWMFVPTLGGNPAADGPDMDYYHVVGHGSYSQLGQNFDTFFNGGGMQAQRAHVDGVVSCDVPRMYDVKQVSGLAD